MCDRALPGIGIETLGGFASVPEINASSGLIVSVEIVFSYKSRNAAIVRSRLLEHRLRVVAGRALRKSEANDCGDHCNLLQLSGVCAPILFIERTAGNARRPSEPC